MLILILNRYELPGRGSDSGKLVRLKFSEYQPFTLLYIINIKQRKKVFSHVKYGRVFGFCVGNTGDLAGLLMMSDHIKVFGFKSVPFCGLITY